MHRRLRTSPVHQKDRERVNSKEEIQSKRGNHLLALFLCFSWVLLSVDQKEKTESFCTKKMKIKTKQKHKSKKGSEAALENDTSIQ